MDKIKWISSVLRRLIEKMTGTAHFMGVTAIFIVLFLILVLVLDKGCHGPRVARTKFYPPATLEEFSTRDALAFLDAINTRRLETAYGQTTEQFRERVSYGSFAEWVETNPVLKIQKTPYRRDKSISDDLLWADLTLVLKEDNQETILVKIRLQREGKYGTTFRIDSVDIEKERKSTRKK